MLLLYAFVSRTWAPAGAKGWAIGQAKLKAEEAKRYTKGIPVPKQQIGPYDSSTSISVFFTTLSDAAGDANYDEQVTGCQRARQHELVPSTVFATIHSIGGAVLLRVEQCC